MIFFADLVVGACLGALIMAVFVGLEDWRE